jgi:hypothetical protein
MNRVLARNIALSAALAAVTAGPAATQVRRDAIIHFHGGSVAFIAGVNWGGGTLDFRGHHYPLKVRGLGVGAIGVTKFSAAGAVYHLHRPSDIEGKYGAVNASATIGGGKGVLSMKNGKGVEIDARANSEGLALSLAPSGMEIELER